MGSPATGWNVVGVGASNDHNTGAWFGTNPDILWYIPSPCCTGTQRAQVSTWPYNSHGDFNKPEVTAPGVDIETANGERASGTSVAAPIVSGIAAQLMARNATLLSWPEVVRAVIMASALHHTQMPAGGTNADHEGVGTVTAKWANVILVEGGGGNGGFKKGSMSASTSVTQGFTAVQGDKVRVVLAWDSHTSGTGLFNRTDTLTADLDLEVRAPNGATYYSTSYDNAYEFLEFTAPVTGTDYVITVRKPRFDASLEYYAIAWTKWSGTP